MIEFREKVVTETWITTDGRFKIEGQIIGETRQAYIPFEWRNHPSYGYYSFIDKGGTIGFRTHEECVAFLTGILNGGSNEDR